MRRCPGCGAFFPGDECPNQHDLPFDPLPPLTQRHAGRFAVYDWPGGGPLLCVVTSEPDEDGNVGLMVMTENVRVPLDDLKEPDGN